MLTNNMYVSTIPKYQDRYRGYVKGISLQPSSPARDVTSGIHCVQLRDQEYSISIKTLPHDASEVNWN